MTTYKTIRWETKENEIFFEIKVNDSELGIFNYGKWLLLDEVEEYNNDNSTKDTILTSYLPEALQWKTDQNNYVPPVED